MPLKLQLAFRESAGNSGSYQDMNVHNPGLKGTRIFRIIRIRADTFLILEKYSAEILIILIIRVLLS